MDLSYPFYALCRRIHQLWEWMMMSLTPLGIGVVCMAIASASLGFWSSQGLCHHLFFLSVALLILALIGRRFIQVRIQAERQLPRFGTVGEAMSYRILLKNLMASPQVGLVLAEAIATPFLSFQEFGQVRRQRVRGESWFQAIRQALRNKQRAIAPVTNIPRLSARGKTEVMGELIPLRRGQLRLDGLSIKASDPLGLSYHCTDHALAQSVCILPQRYQLPPLFSADHQAAQRGVAVLTQAVGESPEFRALRDYRPGDPINKIHWKSWAKVGRPVVREHHEEASIRHGLLLDTLHPESNSDVFEEMVAIAISILMAPLAESEQLDVIFAGQNVSCQTIGGRSQHRENLLEAIATLTPRETHTFQSLMPLAQSRLLQWSSCVCVFVQWDRQRHEFLERLANCGISTSAFVICDGQQSHEGLRYLSFSHRCTAYFISCGQIQQDLRTL